jgi:hypothetical protein
MSNITNIKEKVDHLEKQQRLLWPKFDQELKGKLQGQTIITKFITETFKASQLEKDLGIILQHRSIEEAIKIEMGSSKDVELYQKQVVNVIKYLYDFDQKKETP